MPPEQDAGAIIVQLKAQIESLEKGFAKAKQTIAGFGKDTQAAAGTVSKAGTRITSAFTDIDRRSVQTAARLARFTQRIISLQFALSALQQVGGKALRGFATETQAVTNGLQTFAAIATLVPNKFGLMAAGAAGAAAGFKTVSEALEEIEQRNARLQRGLDRNFQRASIFRGRDAATDALDPSQGGRLQRQIDRQREIFLQREGEIQARRDELAKVGGTGTPLERDLKRRELNNEIERLGAESRAAFDELKRLNGELDRTKSVESYQKSMAQLSEELQALPELVKHGLIDAAAAEEKELDLLNKQIELLIRNKNLLTGSAEAQDIGAAINRLELKRADLDFKVGFRASEEGDKKRRARELEELKGEVDRQAQNFGGAIAAGIEDGILSGASAMETLAGVGRNLFSNMVRDLANNLQSQLSTAFKAIAGEAGVGIATALTAAIGVAGAIFSHRKSKSSQSFESIRSQVDDSTPLRGIVAGPSNIAIATVGEDIARAIAPVVDGIKALASIMGKVEANTRGGSRPGGGGGLDPVFVPTSP